MKKVDNENAQSNENLDKEASSFVMKSLEEENVIKGPESEPNKPAHWSMRVAAGIVDICIIFMAIFGLYRLFALTSLADGLRDNAYNMQRIRDNYKLVELISGSTETIGYKLYETDPSFNDEKYKDYTIYTFEDVPYKVVNYDSPSLELQNKYVEVVTNDQNYQNYSFNYRLCDFGVMSLAAAISEIVFIIGVPLLNKRRATLGKLAAGTQVIHFKYQTTAKWYQVVGKFFWIYIFESIIPFLIISNALLIAVLVQPILFIISLFNKNHRMLHDYVSRTLVIDKRTFVPLDEQ